MFKTGLEDLIEKTATVMPMSMGLPNVGAALRGAGSSLRSAAGSAGRGISTAANSVGRGISTVGQGMRRALPLMALGGAGALALGAGLEYGNEKKRDQLTYAPMNGSYYG